MQQYSAKDFAERVHGLRQRGKQRGHRLRAIDSPGVRVHLSAHCARMQRTIRNSSNLWEAYKRGTLAVLQYLQHGRPVLPIGSRVLLTEVLNSASGPALNASLHELGFNDHSVMLAMLFDLWQEHAIAAVMELRGSRLQTDVISVATHNMVQPPQILQAHEKPPMPMLGTKPWLAVTDADAQAKGLASVTEELAALEQPATDAPK